jgi:hypothetical protein
MRLFVGGDDLAVWIRYYTAIDDAVCLSQIMRPAHNPCARIVRQVFHLFEILTATSIPCDQLWQHEDIGIPKFHSDAPQQWDNVSNMGTLLRELNRRLG